MRTTTRSALTVSISFLLGVAGACMFGLGGRGDQPDQREVTPLASVPDAVKKAVEAHAPGMTFTHAWKAMDNETLFYIVRGKAKDADLVEFTAMESGRLVEVRHDMTPDRLPADITEAVKRLVPNAKILKGDRHMAIRWLITVQDGPKTREVLLRADGKQVVRDAEVKPVAETKPAGK